MQIIGWVLFGVMLIWHFYNMKYNHMKRIALENYVVYLLLNDELRQKHKQVFGEWIKASNVSNALELTMGAQKAIEGMADNLAKNSTLGTHAMLWHSEYAKKFREKYTVVN